MNINDTFPSKHLKSENIGNATPTVTIAKVEVEPVGRKNVMKAVVYFVGKEKGMVLNKTNANRIAELVGSTETDHWAGFAIQLYAADVEFEGKTVKGLRVRKAAGQATPPVLGQTPQLPPPAPPAQRESYDDRQAAAPYVMPQRPVPALAPQDAMAPAGEAFTSDDIPF